MNTLLQVQILLCRDNDGIVAGSANDRAGGEEVDQGHGNPHTHPQQCHTVQGHPTHYFLVDIFMFIFFIFFNEAYLLTLSSSALTTVKSTALWCFNGTSPPSSSLQVSNTTMEGSVALLGYNPTAIFGAMANFTSPFHLAS